MIDSILGSVHYDNQKLHRKSRLEKATQFNDLLHHSHLGHTSYSTYYIVSAGHRASFRDNYGCVRFGIVLNSNQTLRLNYLDSKPAHQNHVFRSLLMRLLSFLVPKISAESGKFYFLKHPMMNIQCSSCRNKFFFNLFCIAGLHKMPIFSLVMMNSNLSKSRSFFLKF